MGDLKPFGKLSKEEKLALLTGWVNGDKVQFKSESGHWQTLKYPSWMPTKVYRTAPQKPSINWDHVDKKYNWLCIRSEGGDPYLFEKKPSCDPEAWLYWLSGGGSVSAKGFSSLKVGNCEPEDSLVGRHDRD